MRGVRGVTEVNSHGGFAKTYEVRLDPNLLTNHRVALAEVFEALSRNNASAGGGYVVHQHEQRFIRGQALLRSIEDIEQIVVRSPPGGVPLLLKDLGEVKIAPLTRQKRRYARWPWRDRDRYGDDGARRKLVRRVVHAVKERLDEIQRSLPAGVSLEVIYDRSELIDRTLDTVLHNLAAGGTLVIVVLLLLLGSIRAGIVVALAIPLSMLFATNMMAVTGVTASLMSLGT